MIVASSFFFFFFLEVGVFGYVNMWNFVIFAIQFGWRRKMSVQENCLHCCI